MKYTVKPHNERGNQMKTMTILKDGALTLNQNETLSAGLRAKTAVNAGDKKMPKTTISRILFLALLIAAAPFTIPAYANPNCGDTITSSVTLSADLLCKASDGLNVGADNVTINLNGHTISCVDNSQFVGFLGSCESLFTSNPAMHFPTGITSYQHNNVTILGPGTVYGFNIGIFLGSGSNLHITGVTISAPPPTEDYTVVRRGFTSIGAEISSTQCSIGSFFLPTSESSAEFNDISQYNVGFQLLASSCVRVAGNIIHDNSGPKSTALWVYDTSNSTITTNQVYNNMLNTGYVTAGIFVYGLNSPGSPPDNFNQIQNNYVFQNCGDGIALSTNANMNNVSGNVALNNGLSSKCPLANFTGHDFDGVSEGVGNVWSTNNTCHTEGPGVPAGVCN
jgi:hypothetical protein